MTTLEFDAQIDQLQKSGWVLQCTLAAQPMRNPLHFWNLSAGHTETQQVYTGRGSSLEIALTKLMDAINQVVAKTLAS